MTVEKELSFNDYFNIVKRKLPQVVVYFLLVFMAVIAFAIWIPPTYKATATILIESQQIKPDQAKEKYAADRFSALNQVVLSKDNLINIAKNYKLYGLDNNPEMSRETINTIIRSNILVERLRAEPEGWEGAATFAFNVSFLHSNAEETYKITNDLATLFLDENDRVSKERAFETADFFSNEEAKQRAELEKIEKKVTDYKRLYADSLPENKQIYVGSMDRLETDLRATRREYSATQAELRSLDVSLESAKAGIGLITPQERITAPTDLDGLKLELIKQKSIYNDNHPAVRVLQRRIDDLEKNLAVTPGKTEPAKTVTAQSAMVAKVQAQIDTANSRLKSLSDEEATIRARISQAEGRVIRGAQTEGALGAMLREYEDAKKVYSEVKSKLNDSKIAKNIEMKNKGERFVLVEQPLFPRKPIKPNRKLIIIAGFFAAIAFATVLAILTETLDKRIRGVDSFASVMKVQPMATIPYITNKAELRRKKYKLINSIISVLALALFLLLIVHFFVMPVDAIAAKIIARF